MYIIHSGMAYAIHIDIFIIMLLITYHDTWTELQTPVLMWIYENLREMYENASGNDI